MFIFILIAIMSIEEYHQVTWNELMII